MIVKPVIIGETSRLLIRCWLKEDLEAWLSLSQDDGLNKFSISGYRMKDRKAAEEFIDKAMTFFEKTGLLGPVPIFLKDTFEMIGICGLKPAKLDDEPAEKIEVMYRLAQPYWGKGYATEAGKLLLEYGFKKKNLDQMIGFIVPDNHPSRAVLLRLGMTFVRKSKYSGHDIELYKITADQIRGGRS